jgi:hypothetical protein
MARTAANRAVKMPTSHFIKFQNVLITATTYCYVSCLLVPMYYGESCCFVLYYSGYYNPMLSKKR